MDSDDIDVMFDEDKDIDVEQEAPKEPEVKTPEQEDTPEQPEPVVPEQPNEPTPPQEPEQPKPLTADEVRSIISDLRNQERDSGKELEVMEKEVIEAYYPQGLSNTLVDEKTGQEIKTPQDVVELSGGEMTVEQATQWLMNEQYKLDRKIDEVKQSARELAETNSNFKTGVERVVDKYKDVFGAFPQLQGKVYKNYMKTVRMDNEKDLVLAAPDIEEYYGDFMEPYLLAFNAKQSSQPAPAQPTAPAQHIPESKQTATDRMDISGDGGGSDSVNENDPEETLSKLFGE